MHRTAIILSLSHSNSLYPSCSPPPVYIQVESITKEAERLISSFPDAQEHIAAKHEEMVGAWNR